MKTIYTLLMLFVIIFTNAQTSPTLYNNLGSDWPYSTFLDKSTNHLYLCYFDQGTIKKINLNTPNAPVVTVISGLSYPTEITVINNKLYVIEPTSSLVDDMPIPNTGKLSYFDLSITNPSKVTLYNNMNAPVKLAAGNGFVITDENTISAVDPDDFEEQIISKWSITGTPQKTTLLTRAWASDVPTNEAFEHFEVVGDFMYANSNAEYSNDHLYKFNLQNLTLEQTPHIFTETTDPYYSNAPYSFGIYDNHFFYSNSSGPGSNFRTQLSSPTITPITENFSYNGNGVGFYEWEFDAQGNAFVLGESYDSSNSFFLIFKYTKEQLLSSKESTLLNKNKFYPNPTKSILNFSQELSEIKILDMNGKLISQKNEKSKNISLENLPKGIYIINGKNNDGEIISEKFIKE